MSSSPLEPKFAKVRIEGRVQLIRRSLLNEEEKKRLDSSLHGVLELKLEGPENQMMFSNKSTETTAEEMETQEERQKRVQDESDRKLGRAIRNLQFIDCSHICGPGIKDKDVKMVAFVVDHLSQINKQLGEQALDTIFRNPRNLASTILGIGHSTVKRKVVKALSDTTPKDTQKEEQKKKRKN